MKKTYKVPQLFVHGTVAEITLKPGGSGQGINGNSQKCSVPGDGSGMSNSPVSFCTVS